MRKITFKEVAHLYMGIQGRMRDKGTLTPGIWTLVGVSDHKTFDRRLTLRNEDGNEFGECPDMKFQPCMRDPKYMDDETLIIVLKRMSLNDLSKAHFRSDRHLWNYIEMKAFHNQEDEKECEYVIWSDYNHMLYSARNKQGQYPVEDMHCQTEALTILLERGFDFFNLLESMAALPIEWLKRP